MRQARTGQGNRDVVHQLSGRVDHPVVHVRGFLGVVEKQHLAGGLVHLGVGRYAPARRGSRHPVGLAQLLEGVRVELVQLAALVEAGDRPTAVDDHIGAGRVLQSCACAAAVAQRLLRRFHETGPQRPALRQLGLEPVGADEAVAIFGLPVVHEQRVQHPVAIKRMVPADCIVQRVLRVAQVHAGKVVGKAAGNREIHGIVLAKVRLPRTRPVRMIVVLR